MARKTTKDKESKENSVDSLNARRAELYSKIEGNDNIPDEQLPPGYPISTNEIIPSSPTVASDSADTPEPTAAPIPVAVTVNTPSQSSYDNLTPQVLAAIKDRAIAQTREEEAKNRKQLEEDLQKTLSDFDKAREESQKREEALRAEIDKTREDAKMIMGLLANGSDIVGSAVAEVSQFGIRQSDRTPFVYGGGGSNYSDAYREMEAILSDKDRTPSYIGYNPVTGKQTLKRDTTALDRFIASHTKEAKDGLERALKRNGLLTGSASVRVGRDAPTNQGTVAPYYNEMLSGFLRQTHSAKYVFWQFVTTSIQAERNAGDTITVARYLFGDRGTTANDWRLGPNALITPERQPIQASSVQLVVDEFGMGASAKVRPVSIPQFIQATCLADLLSALNVNLRANYEEFEDISIRSEYQKTTRVVYNNKSGIDTVVGNLNTASNGTLTLGFLSNLRAYLSGLQIPAFPDGSYVIVVNSRALAQLVTSLGQFNQFVNKQSIDEITNLVKEINRFPDLKVNGYQFNVGGFMVFESNAISGGIPGTEGVQTVTTGAGAQTARSSYAFGRDCVAKAIVDPFTIKQDSPSGQFNRFTDYIWTEISGVAPLDVDPASNPLISASQQLRVVEVRTLDVEI